MYAAGASHTDREVWVALFLLGSSDLRRACISLQLIPLKSRPSSKLCYCSMNNVAGCHQLNAGHCGAALGFEPYWLYLDHQENFKNRFYKSYNSY